MFHMWFSSLSDFQEKSSKQKNMSKFLPLLVLASLVLVINATPVEDPKLVHFQAIRYDGFSPYDIDQVIYDAGIAKEMYPGDPNKIGQELRVKFDNRYGIYFCCFVTTGRLYTSYWYNRYNVLLQSTTGDNQYIDCYRTGRFSAMDDQVKFKLLA